MDLAHLWQEIVNWLSLGAKWEVGVYRLFHQGQPFLPVLWKTLAVVNLPILIIFGFLDLFFVFFKWLSRPLVPLIKKYRKESSDLDINNNNVNDVIEDINRTKNKIINKMRQKVKELVRRYGYWAFFFIAILPFVPWLTEIAAAFCVSIYGRKAISWSNLKGFLAIVIGNSIKVAYTLGGIYGYFHF
ncbi:MAG: hypothetical protein PHT40_00365 [Patescibacteria group bacterium]|nr:hypothetical protein [Patescibacteria group bacterium]